MPRFTIILDDEKHSKLTPEFLKHLAKKASSSLGFKVMTGQIEPMFDKELVAVVGILSEAEIIWEKETGDNIG